MNKDVWIVFNEDNDVEEVFDSRELAEEYIAEFGTRDWFVNEFPVLGKDSL